MGLESGWNCHISLKSAGEAKPSTKVTFSSSDAAKGQNLYDVRKIFAVFDTPCTHFIYKTHATSITCHLGTPIADVI